MVFFSANMPLELPAPCSDFFGGKRKEPGDAISHVGVYGGSPLTHRDFILEPVPHPWCVTNNQKAYALQHAFQEEGYSICSTSVPLTLGNKYNVFYELS